MKFKVTGARVLSEGKIVSEGDLLTTTLEMLKISPIGEVLIESVYESSIISDKNLDVDKLVDATQCNQTN